MKIPAIFKGMWWMFWSLLTWKKVIYRCPDCLLVLRKNIEKCPRCGVEIKW